MAGMMANMLVVLAAGLSASHSVEIDRTVAALFTPYSQEVSNEAVWERPIFSQEVTALVAHWKRVMPTDEVDAMNDGDWLCQCQDWNARGFKTSILSRKALPDGRVQVKVRIDLGFGEASGIRQARMIFSNEGGRWKLDDIFAKDAYPRGLKQALRETIREDEALRNPAR